jgi:hypothetical protein
MSDKNNDRSFARTYNVELLFENSPEINVDSALNELEKSLGKIVHKKISHQHLFFLVDHQINYEDGQAPSQLLLIHSDPDKDDAPLTEEIQQSWQTPNASEIVERSKYKVLLTDLMSAALDIKERHDILYNAISSFVKHSNCLGVANKQSQQIISSDAINNSNDPLLGFVNIRLFNAGEKGFVMDSMGLAALGMYDVQCHFFKLDPNEVSSLLYNITYYIFYDEPQFENGHTVSGINGEKWNVQFERALIAPNRDVLDINPGTGYAAGNR